MDSKNDRLARRFARGGADGMSDAELLELLLRFAAPEAQAQALAQLLMERFSSLWAILEASQADLLPIDGLDENAVRLLRLVPELHRRYFLSRSDKETRLSSNTACGNYLLPYFYGAREELVYLLALDATGKVLACRLLGRGSINSANVPMRRLVHEALAANASALVLAHNHPSGIALPSKEDVTLTLRLREALDIMDILLLDHLVIADDDFVSMSDSGYLPRN
ncbi:MAG: DNA repair protein RadC [Oscillospiraceae bacterium]|jgi:DNA repair protein RadC|nr:DNA repair protein RadC [Oscillospiraceae bacterium]